MANAKKGQSVKAPPFCAYNKHFRPEGKRMFWKKQRSADRQECLKEQAAEQEDTDE